MTGGMTLAPADSGAGGRLGSRMVGTKAGLGAAFALGAVFAVGWTPCIGVILGGILTMAASSGTALQGAVLLIAYTLGLGIPFLLIAVFYDRAPRLMRVAEQHCLQARCTQTVITVINLRTELAPFYQSLGYSPQGTLPYSDTHRATQPCHFIVMVKPLTRGTPADAPPPPSSRSTDL